MVRSRGKLLQIDTIERPRAKRRVTNKFMWTTTGSRDEFSRSEYPSLVKIGHTYLKLYGECLDALLNSVQSDAVKLDCGEGELIQ